MTTTASLADHERAELADLMERLGPDAPTCCAGWSTANLAAHLVVRDQRPDALPGYGLETLGIGRPLSAWSHRLEDQLRASTPYAEVLRRLRSGAPPWSPLSWPVLGAAMNTAEFAIHHEDVRRAQPEWSPRELPRSVQDALWAPATFYGRRATGQGALVLRRSDVAGVERRMGSGEPVTTVEGTPMEVLLWAAGRRGVARVAVT